MLMNLALPWSWLRSRLAVPSNRERKEHNTERNLDIIVLLLKLCFAQNVLPYPQLKTGGNRKPETEDVLLGDLLVEGKRVCIPKVKVIRQIMVWYWTHNTKHFKKDFFLIILFLWLADFTIAPKKFLRPVITSCFWPMHIMRWLIFSLCVQRVLQICLSQQFRQRNFTRVRVQGQCTVCYSTNK